MKTFYFRRFWRIMPAVLLLGTLALNSCKKDGPTGDTASVAQAKSLLVKPGKYRAEVSWLVSNTNVAKYQLSWGGTSVEGTLERVEKNIPIRIIVDNLPEGPITFNLLLYDKNDKASPEASVDGVVYGTQYEQSLTDKGRQYTGIAKKGDDLEVEWSAVEGDDMYEVHIAYVNINNVMSYHVVSRNTTKDMVPGFPNNGTFEYRTAFLPDPAAIDTFYSSLLKFEGIAHNVVELDKSKWNNHKLPSDRWVDEWGYVIERIWDNNPDGTSFFFMMSEALDPTLTLPHWFTIDLGVPNVLTRIRLHQIQSAEGWAFNTVAPKKYEIYGSNNPNSTGEWDSGWVLLGSFESVKPSGLPLGQLSEGDKTRWRNGDVFDFPESNHTAYRYIRFKTIENWGANKETAIAELTLWGYE